MIKFEIAYQFNLALLRTFRIGHNPIAIATLQNDQTDRLGAIHILVVEKKILVQREPLQLPLQVVRLLPQVAAFAIIKPGF